jgi:tetratricopeptide (TPR) repeat protein
MSGHQKNHLGIMAVCYVLLFGTLLLFNTTLQNGFLDLDDPDYVTLNTHVLKGVSTEGLRWAFTTGDSANWHPLTWLSLMLDAECYGDFAPGFHFTNNLLHALNAVLAFLVLLKMTRNIWPAAICAALFAWHPLRVESVAWVAERKDVLSGLFFWLTLLAYAHYTERREDKGAKTAGFYVAALLLFACGLMSKPMLVTLPFLLLLLDFWPLQRWIANDNWVVILKLGREKIPFFMLSAASCVITFLVQKNWGAVVESEPASERLANAIVAIVRYAGKFFWPENLAIVYSLPQHWAVSIVTASATLILGITALAITQMRRRPWLFVGWFWLIGMLVPVIGVVQVGLQAMADRYTYLPMVGLQIALLWTLRELKFPVFLKAAAVSIALAGCVMLTWTQIGFWKSPQTLYAHTLAVTKDNYLADDYLGTALLNSNRFYDAAIYFRRAIELKPDFNDAYFKLGTTLANDGKTADALTTYEQLREINPRYALADYNIGILLLAENRTAEAISCFNSALGKKKGYDPAYVALGTAEARLQNSAAAIGYFQKALALKPDNAVAEYNLANALTDAHREQDALSHYQKAVALKPDFADAQCNWGNALGTLGQPAEAMEHFRHALVLDPQNEDACFSLATAFEDLKNVSAAARCYQRVLSLDPQNATAHYNLATIWLNENHCADALEQFTATTALQPDNDSAFLGAGLAEEEMGHSERATEDYRRAIVIAPDNMQAHCCLGIALRRTGKYTEAIAEEESALRLDPHFPGLQEQLALTRREQATQ